MLRKMMIALFACASVAVLAPDAALARGGFGGGGGGFHGGGGGFRGGGMGMGGGFRAAGIGGGGFRAAALPAAGFRGGTLAVNRFHGGFNHGFRHRRFPFAVTAVGLGLGYGYYNDYYDYGDPYYGSYDDSYYYGDSGCYIVRRSVRTPYGWRIRPVQVCG